MRSYCEAGTALSESPDGPITAGPVRALDTGAVRMAQALRTTLSRRDRMDTLIQ